MIAVKPILALTLTMLAASLICGCGGGGEEVSATATLTGTVTAPAVTTAAAENPAAYCQVTVEQSQTRSRLGSAQADASGQYSIGPIRAGQTVMVRATLRDGSQLMTRAQLRDGSCAADIDQDTTLAATVVESLQDAGLVDEDLQETVSGVCAMYQARNRYRYRTAGDVPPDFTNPDEVDETAEDLLNAAAQEALAQAQATRTAPDCDNAAAMVEARLRQGNALAPAWGPQNRKRLSQAMQAGRQFSLDEVSQAGTVALLGTVTTAGGDKVRKQFEQQIQNHYAGDMEGPEAVEVLCIQDGTPDQVRLRTRDQLQTCVDALLGS